MTTIQIPIERIDDNPWQTRHSYDEAYIEQLAGDINRNGLMQPPAARLVDAAGAMIPVAPFWLKSDKTFAKLLQEEHPDARLQLAFGHNRLRAFKLTGAKAFPVSIKDLSDEQMAIQAWSENEQRKNLTPVEEALAIQKRMAHFGWTQAQVAEQLGLGRSTVANKLRMLKLPEGILEHVAGGELSERQAIALVPAYTEITDEDLEMMAEDEQSFYFNPPDSIVEQALAGRWSAENIRTQVNIAKERIERTRERQKKIEEAKSKHAAGDIPHVRDMSWDSYESLHGDVAGCTGDCACRAKAIGYDEKVVEICTDPSRRQSLRRQHKKNIKKERNERVNKQRSEFWKQYFDDSTFTWTPAVIRILAEEVVLGTSKDCVIRALDKLAQLGALDENERQALDGLAAGNWNNREPGLDAIEKLPLDTAMMLILACKVEYGFMAIVEHGEEASWVNPKWPILKDSLPYGDVCAQT